ncbi:RNA polymerase sigma factor [Kytococcus sedentarius]|uniref:RNA polymerase sigma factor n=1 Tax=Kytococcus sedentarius TaxID=1276 RepID=UPI00194EA8D9|nr:RNA polymerase sigma factor [Kytococcus sedentarius]QRO86466.1 RNA polymerase sigma factor [Kytococcus sedentarius]
MPPAPARADDAVNSLHRAVVDGDGTTARRVLAEAGEEVHELLLSALARAAGREDTGALATELLVEELDAAGTVRRMVGASLLDGSAVDDVSQDVLISVAESLPSFRGGSKLSTWVHSIVRRRVADHLRRQRASAPLPEEEAHLAARMSSMIATRATVQEALAQLPELYREPVVLRDVDGLPYADVAERLGRPLGTVKVQIARGRAMVAARIQAPERAPGDRS